MTGSLTFEQDVLPDRRQPPGGRVRQLGERASYSAYGPPLGRLVHSDYHAWALLEDADTTALLDGLHSSWPTGESSRGRGMRPSDAQCEEMQRRPNRLRELARVVSAIPHLRDWEPHGEIMHGCLVSCCLRGDVYLVAERGWRHSGEGYERWKGRMCGKDNVWSLLERAWGIVAVLAVEDTVRAQAIQQGAADMKAVAWATERGWIP